MASIAAYGDTAWNTAGTSFTSASVSWSAGDLVLCICGIEDAGATINTPTFSGGTFSQVDANTAASTANAKSFQCTPASSGSGTVNFTTSVSKQGGISVWVITGTSGLGDHKEQHTATKTVASTRQGTGPSIYVWCCLDFAGDGVGSGTPSPTTQRRAVAGNSDYLLVDLINVTTNQSYGETGGGSAGPFTLLVMEAKDAGAASIYIPTRPLLPTLHRMGKTISAPWLPFPLPQPAVAAGPVSETPTPGGAVADGFGPVAQVPSSTGGAVAAGNAPTTQASVTQGGAIAGGTAATARVPVNQGGAVAGGNAPTESFTSGETPAPGGAIAGGFGPVAQVTLSIGGAAASGTAPTVRITVTQGGATAAGFGPSPARVTFTIGGAVAGGFAPGEVGPNTPVPGGAIAGGFGPTARVSLTIGGAVAGGTAPAQGQILTIGGASTGGFGAIVRVNLVIQGAIAGGFEPTIPVTVPLPPFMPTSPSKGIDSNPEGRIRSARRRFGLSTAPHGRIKRG